MADGMMPGLAGLAQGLRLAGGVLSPRVFETVAREDERDEARAQQMRLAQIQQTVKGIEMGAIEPEAGKQVLKQLGFEAPVGPGPEAIARQEAVQRRREMATAMSKLPPNASFEDRLTAMAPHMEPAQQIAAFTAVTGKREQLAAREAAAQRAHEVNLLRAESQQARDAEIARWHEIQAKLTAERDATNALYKQLDLQIRGDRAADERAKVLDNRVAALGRAIDKSELAVADGALRDAENAFIAAPNAGEYTTGPKSLLPDRLVGEKIRVARQALQKLFNIQLKDRSGAAVTPPEWARLREEFGQGLYKTEDQVLSALEAARRVLDQQGLSVAAGFAPEVLKTYNENLGAIGGSVFIGGEKTAPLRQRMKGEQAAAPAAAPAGGRLLNVSGANPSTQITIGGRPVTAPT